MAQKYYTQGQLTSFKEALIGRLGYLMIRNTTYKFIYDKYKPAKLTNDLNHRQKGSIAAFSGGLATLFMHPFDCISVRKIADVGRAAQFQRPDMMHNISHGVGINVLRSFVLNGILIWPYDVMKEKLYITFGDIWPNRFIALFVATWVGIGATFIMDNIKTRFMVSYDDPKLNRLNYSSYSNAFGKAIFHEGYLTFIAGLHPMFMKMFLYSASVFL